MKRKIIKVGILLFLAFSVFVNISFGKEVEKFSNISIKKSDGKPFGSESLEDMKKNLEELDKITNKEKAYKKIILLQLYRNKHHFAKNIEGNKVAKAMIGRLETVIKYELYNGDSKWKTSKAFEEDMKEVNKYPHVQHHMIADIAQFIPKLIEKGDEVVDRLNENTEALNTKADKTLVYTKEESDEKYATKTKLDETKSELNVMIDKKADKDSVYTKKEADERFAKIDATIEGNEARIEALQSETTNGIATIAALSGLSPLSYDINKPTHLMASIGTYNGHQSFAIGLAHYFNSDFIIRSGGAFTFSNKALAGNVGISYRFGSTNKVETESEKIERLERELKELKESR